GDRRTPEPSRSRRQRPECGQADGHSGARLEGNPAAHLEGSRQRQHRDRRRGRCLLRFPRAGAAAGRHRADLRPGRRAANGDAACLLPDGHAAHRRRPAHQPAADHRGPDFGGQEGAWSGDRPRDLPVGGAQRRRLRGHRAQHRLRGGGEARVHQDQPAGDRHDGRGGAAGDHGGWRHRHARLPPAPVSRPGADGSVLLAGADLSAAGQHCRWGRRYPVPLRSVAREGDLDLAHAGVADLCDRLDRPDTGLRLLRIELRQLRRHLRVVERDRRAADLALPVELRAAVRRGAQFGNRAPDGEGHHRSAERQAAGCARRLVGGPCGRRNYGSGRFQAAGRCTRPASITGSYFERRQRSPRRGSACGERGGGSRRGWPPVPHLTGDQQGRALGGYGQGRHDRLGAGDFGAWLLAASRQGRDGRGTAGRGSRLGAAQKEI
ncbi:MAG: Ribonuclease BN, partial [uncultured Sphingomonas sp.]